MNSSKNAWVVVVKEYQRQFIELAFAHQALCFGQFTLRSGRISPYFFNMGQFSDGASLRVVAQCYAQALKDHPVAFDLLLGPAYKGIPLVAALAMHCSTPEQPTRFAYTRKEAKKHGEGGLWVGEHRPGDRVLVVDDVLTAGSAVSDTLKQHPDCHLAGILVGMDRQERHVDEAGSAAQVLSQRYQTPVFAIITLNDLLHWTQDHPEHHKHASHIRAYQQRYAVGAP